MGKKKLLAFVLCALMAATALFGCKSKKEKPKESASKEESLKEAAPKEEGYETDDEDSYKRFEALLQNLAEGLNEGDTVQMRETFAGETIPGAYLTVSGNYILEFELTGVLNDVILEGDEIEQTLIEDGLVGEEYEEYARQATEACVLEVTIKQTTISDNSVQVNNEAVMIALKIDGKWTIVPWI